MNIELLDDYDEVICVRVPRELKRALRRFVDKHDNLSVSAIVRALLIKFLRDNDE